MSEVIVEFGVWLARLVFVDIGYIGRLVYCCDCPVSSLVGTPIQNLVPVYDHVPKKHRIEPPVTRPCVSEVVHQKEKIQIRPQGPPQPT